MLPPCHVCGAAALERQEAFAALARVTSDCRPWRSEGRLGLCHACGVAQAEVDAAWREEAATIYRDYAVYSQADGLEQTVFFANRAGSPRSQAILERLRAEVGLPERGRALDVGCGSGVTLRALHRLLPAWTAVGNDINEDNRESIEALPGVEAFHAGPATQAQGPFDLVSLVHVLEHVEDPVALLMQLGPLLGRGSLLLVEVPDVATNPFDLVVADHASHFRLDDLERVAVAAGFEIVIASAAWLPKELTLVARWRGPRDGIVAPAGPGDEVAANISWLTALGVEARRLASAGQLGVFGTSIGACWLWQEVEGAATFFVDEDPNRLGSYLGCPVVAPGGEPGGATVVLSLPGPIAERVGERLRRPDCTYVALDYAGRSRPFSG